MSLVDAVVQGVLLFGPVRRSVIPSVLTVLTVLTVFTVPVVDVALCPLTGRPAPRG